MQVIVLGASGYLGGRVANYLMEVGHEVIGHWRIAPGNTDGKVPLGWKEVVCGDLRETEVVAQLAAFGAETVIDMVALNHKQCELDRGAALAVNVGTAWAALEAMAGRGLQKFVYLSTQQVYGRLPNAFVDEGSPTRPLNAYGATHLAAEGLLEARGAALGVNVASIRLSNGCGAPAWTSSDCWWLVINDLCRGARKDGLIHLASDGTPMRDFLHVRDVAHGIEALLLNSKDHSVYNLGSGKTFAILEIAHLVAEVHQQRYGARPRVILGNGSESVSSASVRGLPRFTYDCHRIRDCGWAPSRSIEEAIDEVFAFLDANA